MCGGGVTPDDRNLIERLLGYSIIRCGNEYEAEERELFRCSS